MCAARELPLRERLAKCTAMKAEGNGQIRHGRYGEACHTYEQVSQRMRVKKKSLERVEPARLVRGPTDWCGVPRDNVS